MLITFGVKSRLFDKAYIQYNSSDIFKCPMSVKIFLILGTEQDPFLGDFLLLYICKMVSCTSEKMYSSLKELQFNS